ncbi:GNAT family N-acetyltransferase [Mesorhizobium sp. M0026]|uniref:GNAT family N-acetyltransferase n=1 Tax=Mesorhizobium sp. M0026 TaxID=2956847 RepID=UPI003338F0F7
MKLQTKRLLMREWKDEDVAPFIRMNDDPRVVRYVEKLADRTATEGWIDAQRDHFEKHGYGLWVLEALGNTGLIGYCGLVNVPYQAHFTPAVEIAWRLVSAHWGLGYATEAASAALSFGFERLGLSEVVANAAVGNSASRRVMERLGMSHDAQDDFDLPGRAEGHPLRRQVLYRIKAGKWLRK